MRPFLRAPLLAGVRGRLLAPALAAVLAAVAVLTHASGGDLAAATYRIDLFRQVGLALWDSNWYAGHWTLDYSLLFAPIGATLGVAATNILCATVAAWAFDRLVAPRFGTLGHAAAVLFAAGTIVQVAVGRVPYLLGGTLALLALLVAMRRLWPLAVPLALAAALASPLAGAFLALAAATWFLADLPRVNWRAVLLGAAAVLPVIVLEALFPGQGTMAIVLVLSDQRELRIGAGLYALAVLAAYVIPSSLGVNVVRLATSVGLSVLALLVPALVRPRRHAWAVRTLFLAAVVSLALGEWVPAGGALLGSPNPEASAGYFKPLMSYLVAHDNPLGRIEVVPTATHWESVYVALRLPLARGWERQLDTQDNPIFYVPGRLNARSYHAWLVANGVRYVALANAPLDYIAGPEKALLRGRHVPGLRLVWSDRNWSVWSVAGAAGIVSGPGRLVSERGQQLVLDARRAGALLVRVHFSSGWVVQAGAASLRKSAGGWLRVDVRRPGRVALSVSV
jgi:hypothetical protein